MDIKMVMFREYPSEGHFGSFDIDSVKNTTMNMKIITFLEEEWSLETERICLVTIGTIWNLDIFLKKFDKPN